MRVVAEYIGSSITSLEEYSGLFRQGEYGELNLYLQQLLEQSEVDTLNDRLQGILVEPVRQDGCVVLLQFRYNSSAFKLIADSIDENISEIMVGWQLSKDGSYRSSLIGWLAIGAIAVVALVESRKKKKDGHS